MNGHAAVICVLLEEPIVPFLIGNEDSGYGRQPSVKPHDCLELVMGCVSSIEHRKDGMLCIPVPRPVEFIIENGKGSIGQRPQKI